MKDSNQKENKSGSKEQAVPVWEWLVAGLGLILVVSTVGFLLAQALTGKVTPPEITVEKTAVETVKTGYLVKFRAFNLGDTTAAQVTIEGTLKDASGADAETSAVTLDYAPSRSERKGGLFFTKNPAEFNLELKAKGYEEP